MGLCRSNSCRATNHQSWIYVKKKLSIRPGAGVSVESNLIGIFKVNCVWNQDDPYHETEEMVTILEVVVGRVKVAENLLTTLMMSVGLGLALFIMGMEIDIQQVILVVK